MLHYLFPFLFMILVDSTTFIKNTRPNNFNITEFLINQEVNKLINPTVRNLKFKTMSASPLAFYRGSPQIYYRDLFGNPAVTSSFVSNGTTVWCSGDLHGENFGTYHNSNGEVIYEFNDYDESVMMDYKYDLFRLSTYLVLLSKSLGFNQYSAGWIKQLSQSYINATYNYRLNDNSVLSKFTKETTTGVLKKLIKKAAEGTNLEMLNKYSSPRSGNPNRVFNLHSPDLEPLNPQIQGIIKNEWPSYLSSIVSSKIPITHLAIKDIARRVNAGLSSNGVERYYILVEGPTKSDEDDMILDMKQQITPSSIKYFTNEMRNNYQSFFPNQNSEGRRQYTANYALNRATCKFVGYMAIPASNQTRWSFIITARSPAKGGFKPKAKTTPEEVEEMAFWWGIIMSTQHCRSDKKFENGKFIKHSFANSFYNVTVGKEKQFVDLVTTVGQTYAEQVVTDTKEFSKNFPPITRR